MLRKTNWYRATPAPIGRLRASRDQLFALGQPLDAAEYFMFTPGAIGRGRSSKPSHGLRTKFLHHRFHDIVESDYRLIIEDLGVAICGWSSAARWPTCMPGFWAEMYPGAAPIACQPIEIIGHSDWRLSMLVPGFRFCAMHKKRFVGAIRPPSYAIPLIVLIRNEPCNIGDRLAIAFPLCFQLSL